MSAQDTERAAALERRYRRLLRCYPPGHRQVHREEMLGVLLATARPGQRAPGAGQTVNLIACGLAIRARRALSSLADETWQDALAVVSLITPALMLIIAALDFAAGDPGGHGGAPCLPGGRSVLATLARAFPRGARDGDDRLAGCGAAGADRPAAGRRGDRVHRAGAGTV